MMSPSLLNCTIRPAKESDLQAITEHFKIHFLRGFPLSRYFHLDLDERYFREVLETDIAECMKTPHLNVVAVHNGKIVGICLNEIENKDEKKDSRKVKVKDERLKIIFEIIRFSIKEANVFEKYPDCKKLLLISYISVDNAYRRCGICLSLITKSMEIGMEFGCDLIRADCVSYYVALCLQKKKFDMIFEQDYKDYVVKGKYDVDEEFKENGRIVIRPKKPHNTLTVYARKLCKDNL